MPRRDRFEMANGMLTMSGKKSGCANHCHKTGTFCRDCAELMKSRQQNRKAQEGSVPRKGPNYALMDFSSSSPDSEINLKHASKSENKLIEYQIVDNCKKEGLGYENYNAVPPPSIGNFMRPTPDLLFSGLDEFVNEPVVKNSKAMSSEEEPKVVRKCDDAPSIEEWVSDDEEEDVSQPKIKKKTVRPSIVKKEFVKSKKLLGKSLNKLSNIGKTLTVQEAIKEIRTI
ncbi:hypothetical protein Tco_0031189 [Tanacetum coccineum]